MSYPRPPASASVEHLETQIILSLSLCHIGHTHSPDNFHQPLKVSSTTLLCSEDSEIKMSSRLLVVI